MNFILAISLFVIVSSQNDDWNYEDRGPRTWPRLFEQCGGQNQSPIDIHCRNVKYENIECLNFINYDTIIREAEIENLGGRTIEIIPPRDIAIAISGGNLIGAYKLIQFHFHWGTDNSQGSEHTLGKTQYPLELHFVHINEKYRNIEEAQRYRDGIVVIAVLFEISNRASDAMEIISRGINSVRYADQTESLFFDSTLNELLPREHCLYFRYFGSLTTPTCNEAVTWFVIADTSKVTVQQLERFRKVLRTAPGQPERQLRNNFRPPQPLNGRIIESNIRCSNNRNILSRLWDSITSIIG